MRYRFGNVLLDAEARSLERGGRLVTLQDRAFDVLLYLVRRPGRVVSRSELLATFWGDQDASEQVLSQAVYLARRALGDDARSQRTIRTVRGRGFQLIADVVADEARPASRRLFVGRARELDRLRQAFDRSRERAGVAVLISGPAGIGKSWLLDRFLEEVEALGARVRRGHCVEASGAPAFFPWIQILGEGPSNDPSSESLLGRSQAPRTGDRDAARRLVFEGILERLESWARGGPIVLAFDDLHRADPSSLELLRFVMLRCEAPNLCLVGALRDAEFLAAGPGLASILATTSVHAVPLHGFDADEAVDLARLVLDRRPEADEIEHCLDRTGGNPFYLDQLFRASRAGLTTGTSSVPLGVRALVSEQMRRLDAVAASALELGAVLGREFDPALVARVLDLTRGEVVAALGRAQSLDLVRAAPDSADLWRFPHLLVRDALYALTSAEQIAGCHRSVVDALAGAAGVQDAHAAAIAYHAACAASLGSLSHREAALHVLHAARVSLARLAYEDARVHARRGLELLERAEGGGEPADRLELLLVLGEASVRSGEREPAREIFQEASALAQQLNARDSLVRVALSLAPGFLSMEMSARDPLEIGLLERIAELLPDAPPSLRSRVLARLAVGRVFNDPNQTRHRLAAEACRLAELGKEPFDLLFARTCQIASDWSPDDVEHRRREIPELLRQLERAGDIELEAMCRVFWLSTLLEVGDMVEYETQLALFERRREVSRRPQTRWYPVLFRCASETIKGSLGTAERLIEVLREAGRQSGDATYTHAINACACAVGIHRGRWLDLLPLTEEMVRSHSWLAGWSAGHALVLAELGRIEEAAIELERRLPDDLEAIPRDSTWMISLALAADAASQCKDLIPRSRLEQLFQFLEPYADLFVIAGYGVTFYGSVARVTGTLARAFGDLDLSVELLRHAERREREVGAAAWRTWTLLELGESLRARGRNGDRAEADRVLEEARQLAVAMDLTGPLPRIEAALAKRA